MEDVVDLSEGGRLAGWAGLATGLRKPSQALEGCMSQGKTEAWWGWGWQGGVSSHCVCLCVMSVMCGGDMCTMVCVNVVCVSRVCACTYVWGMVLRWYVVVNSLHVLSFSIHTHVMSDSHVLYVYM